MRLLYFLIVIAFVRCSDNKPSETNDISIKKSSQINEEENTQEIALKPFSLIAKNFTNSEFGGVINSKNLFNYETFKNISEVKEVLISTLPSSELKKWILSHKDNFEKDDWIDMKPICKTQTNSTLLYFLTTIEQISGEGETYSDYWCLSSNDGETISKVTHLGISGIYPRIENGEEEGAEYWIKTTEEETLEISLLAADSIITKSLKYTLREGYDWRVDQNLKINDSVAMPEVIHIFDAL
jgi:hypothetical protein